MSAAESHNPASASGGSYEPMSPVSDNAPISRVPTIDSWSTEHTVTSNAGPMQSLRESSITSLDFPTPPWLGSLSPGPVDPKAMAPSNMDNPLLFHGLPTDNDQVTLSGQRLLDASLNVDLDQFCVLEMPNPIQTPRCISGGVNTPGLRHNANSSQASKVTELLETFDQPGFRVRYPQVAELARTIGLLEELLQSRAATIDEVLRVNKFCMAVLGGIMKSEFFKDCKSGRMMILTTIDLMITLYETGVAEDTTQTCKPATIEEASPRKVSLQFGNFQFEPEDHVMLRNQIVRNELQRCIQMIQDQSSELRDTSTDESAPIHEVHQKWLSVLSNRARILSSSLRST
ncbi:MAG: hypothetical protein LQ341_001164 [Variospora aurantia]|nr:MAG: hypothetical protein LQ341_001164 [Variospora aurantia]